MEALRAAPDSAQRALDLVKAAVDAHEPSSSTLGEVMDEVREVLLGPDHRHPSSIGLHVWRAIVHRLFTSQQEDQDYEALGYVVMDGHNYLDRSSNVNVESMEAFFDATDPALLDFVDALLAFVADLEEGAGRSFAGYVSLRFTGQTRALLGPQLWPLTCAVEVSGLADLDGSSEVIEYAQTLALAPESRCTLHWGQRNQATATAVRRMFGQSLPGERSRLSRWRAVLDSLTSDDCRLTFSNDFTRRTGLEPSA